jgi:heterodisulfide reductase subunit B
MDPNKEINNPENSTMLKIPYYPGCTLKTTAKNFENSAIATARILGIELVELSRWNCCGTVFSLTEDDLIHHVAAIRNLVRVQEMNENGMFKNENRLVTICPMCYNTLKKANLRVTENPNDLQTINDFMDTEQDYKGTVKVVHFLEILKDVGFEKIKEKVKKPLKGLKVSPYYGCMILRPKEIAIDDPEDPKIQDELLINLGAEVVNNPYKKVCCGSYQTVHDKYVVAELAYNILTHAQRNGAEIITTCCPLCLFNLDKRQKEIKEKYPEFQEIPVLSIMQLMALAFGIEEKCCEFDLNYIDPRPLLKGKDFLEDQN